jgi:hypothetical protein
MTKAPEASARLKVKVVPGSHTQILSLDVLPFNGRRSLNASVG